MKCDEIIKKLESLSPVSFAEEWDNVGLLAGRRDKEADKKLQNPVLSSWNFRRFFTISVHN